MHVECNFKVIDTNKYCIVVINMAAMFQDGSPWLYWTTTFASKWQSKIILSCTKQLDPPALTRLTNSSSWLLQSTISYTYYQRKHIMGKIHISTPMKYKLEWISMDNKSVHYQHKRNKLLAKTQNNHIHKYIWIYIGISGCTSHQGQIRDGIMQNPKVNEHHQQLSTMQGNCVSIKGQEVVGIL